MDTKILIAKAALQLSKPVSEVFEAVVDHHIMSNYFISQSNGRMEEGTTVQWSFPEFEGKFPVRIGEVLKDALVVFYWEVQGKEHEVRIVFKHYKDTTVVKITESGEPITDAGIDWVVGNTEGWSSFLLCMKAWLEYGVRLRTGSYDWRFDAGAKI
ncbi:SRPBCC domain-containing protein [Flavobacterium sp. RHBU_24]|uniref:SRPBCC domain-containing protein n=1 Tax=Flavobacterium sp. RHBU_24 TaxID=3391185 RepID=UPI003984874C